MFTDKVRYRPTEAVHVYAIVVDAAEGWAPLPARLSVEIRDWGQAVFQSKSAIQPQDGVAHVALRLPAGTNPGRYTGPAPDDTPEAVRPLACGRGL